MRYLFAFLLMLVWLVPVSAQADATANKQLFDRTIDKLNFQTMEGVYDARFVRKKFPVDLTSREARRDFKEFDGDASFQKLFHNYNDEAEKYKNRFGPGHGPTTLTAFDKALRGMLIDANFEFFIRVLRRDDKQALVKRLETTIKAAVTQYDASGEPQSENRRPDTLSDSAADDNLTPADEAVAATEQVDALNQAVPEQGQEAATEAVPGSRPTGGGWGGTLALVLAVAAAVGVAYLLFVVVPGLRAQQNQLAEAAEVPEAPADNLPVTYAAESYQRQLELRFELLSDEVDELKARVEELELRLADMLVAPADEMIYTTPDDNNGHTTVAHAGADFVEIDGEHDDDQRG